MLKRAPKVTPPTGGTDGKYRLILDALCLQLAWLTAAILHDDATPWLVLMVLIRFSLSQNLRLELMTVASIAIGGVILEALMVVSGLLHYNSNFILPIWLPFLWVLFAFTTRHSLRWIAELKISYQVLIGAVAGVLSYQGAASFDVLNLGPPTPLAITILAVIWAVALPLFIQPKRLRKRRSH